MKTNAKAALRRFLCFGFAWALTRACLMRMPPRLWPIRMRGRFGN